VTLSETRRAHPAPDRRAPVLPQFIGGRRVPASTGAVFDDRDPWDGSVVFTVPAGGADDARDAIDAAASAQVAWSETAPTHRQAVFSRAASILERRSDEIVDLLGRETGAGRWYAEAQVHFAVSLLRQAAALAHLPQGVVIPSDLPGTTAMALRRPVGVVGAIAPWNASLILSARAIAGPLAVGNAVVLKPSEESPYTGGVLWGEIFEEAGLPAGVLNVVCHAPGQAGAIGAELLRHPMVRRINFTGSTPTGRRLAESAGRHLKRVLLQLGGHNPLVVLSGVDLDYAVEAAAFGAFVHQGEICMCVRRIYVEQDIAEAFSARLAAKAASLPVGDPADPRTVIGPLINRWALSMVSRRVEEALAGGARLLAGGSPDPPCYPATVLTEVPPSCELASEETFGPVVILESVADADEAVARANQSRFGLSAGVLAADVATGQEVARRLEAGIVHVNDQPVNDEPQMPFGGMKDSGWGRFGISQAVEEFTELQWMTTRSVPRTFPF
jgi:acyl-CoA reductase-like NAD-dependent aldehyde dehydrogenase